MSAPLPGSAPHPAGCLTSEAARSPRAPDEADGEEARQALLDELRARIGALVLRPAGHSTGPAPPRGPGASSSIRRPSFAAPPLVPAIPLGLETIDGALPAGGLEAHGLHEIRPASVRDRPAALAFALALAGRHADRLAELAPAGSRGGRRGVLWAAQSRGAHETGRLYGPGLFRLGLPPDSVLAIEARRGADVLWAMEEGLRSGALSAVLGLVEAVAVTPARRLVLAAAEAATPCLVLARHDGEGIGPAHTRWRVKATPGAPHPFDATAPGAWRFELALERCRQGPSGLSWILEWCDATHRFRLAPPLADREIAAGGARRGAR